MEEEKFILNPNEKFCANCGRPARLYKRDRKPSFDPKTGKQGPQEYYYGCPGPGGWSIFRCTTWL